MNRDYLVKAPLGSIKRAELYLQTAFHEAGHAAAIYLTNQSQGLPPIPFQIEMQGYGTLWTPVLPECKAAITGGQHVHFQPGMLDSLHSAANTVLAFETDIINLLSGPLAEAKHVAERDGEFFDMHLFNLETLRNYGGSSDLEKVYAYTQELGSTATNREIKLQHLFAASYQLICQPEYWAAISALAGFIVQQQSHCITSDEAILVLESALQKKR